MKKRLVFSIILLIFVSCSSSRKTPVTTLTPEQAAEVKANDGFNPYYISPENGKVWMPKKPKHLR